MSLSTSLASRSREEVTQQMGSLSGKRIWYKRIYKQKAGYDRKLRGGLKKAYFKLPL